MLYSLRSQLSNITDKVNNEIIENENRTSSIIFLAKSKILSQSRNIGAIREFNFLIFNIRETLKLLSQIST